MESVMVDATYNNLFTAIQKQFYNWMASLSIHTCQLFKVKDYVKSVDPFTLQNSCGH